MDKFSHAIRSKSKINYDYVTVRITQSRIDKGLIAIPVSLTKWFPKRGGVVHVYFDDSSVSQPKTYSSYDSTTRECRIGGIKDWFTENKIKNGDEIVIQIIDKENFIYRLIPEQMFIDQTQDLQHSFDNSKSEREASEKITALAQRTNLDKGKVVLNEYHRLINTLPTEDRQYIKRHQNRARESVPNNIRTLLDNIYKGYCQVCDFWFLKRDNKPYFETHHLDPLQGHHPKNVIVVCGNCHNQFEYANAHHEFNNEGWLIKVLFNERPYSVNQFALNTKLEDSVKELFI